MRVLIFLLLVSCSTLTEEEKYDRDTHYAEALDLYLARERACVLNRGYMVRRFTERQLERGTVHPLDLKMAYCQSTIR